MYGLSFLTLLSPVQILAQRLSPRVTTDILIVLLAQGFTGTTCTSITFCVPILLLTARFPLSFHLPSWNSCITLVLSAAACL